MEKTGKMKNVLYLGIWNVVEAVIMLVTGICFLIFCQNEDLHNIFLIIVGALLIADGALRILTDLAGVLLAESKDDVHSSNAVVGAFELAIGIAIVSMDVLSILNILANFLGIALIVVGSFLIIFAITFIAKKLYSVSMVVLECIFGAIFITLGALVLVYMSNDQAVFMMVSLIIIGLMLTIAGIVFLLLGIRLIKAGRALVKAQKAAEAVVEEPVYMGETDLSKEATNEVVPTTEVKEEPVEEEKKEAIEHKDVKEVEAPKDKE